MKVTEGMAWLKILFCGILCVVIVTTEYTDDPEYSDFDFYEDLSEDRSVSLEKERVDTVQNNFYMTKAFEDAGIRRNVYASSKDDFVAFGSNIDSLKRNPFGERYDWYKLPEKVYRYTKHRIPGYDYDEFDYARSRSFQECDDRSVWTHCLCQFTCSEPDVVDCYTPCRSGCECKEEYVFDERTQKCQLPQHCSSEDTYNYQM